MMMRFLIAFLIAIGVGKLVSKLKLPAILGWYWIDKSIFIRFSGLWKNY